MSRKLIGTIALRPWLRITLAVALIMVGLAPVGAPILSDNSWLARPEGAAAGMSSQALPFSYRWSPDADDTTRIYRSDDGGQTWHEVAALPQPVLQLEAARGNEQLVLARSSRGIWTSRDGGATWSRSSGLPSRPLSLATVPGTPALVFAGTESAGLWRSNDGGDSWQAVESAELAGGGTAPVGVTALAVAPDDAQIIYAAPGIWLGTSQARFTPLGIYASVDGGRQWFEMSRAPLGAAPVESLNPATGSEIAVFVANAEGTDRVELGLTPGLLAALDDGRRSPNGGSAARRAAAARAIGLVGDATALPVLLARLRSEPDLLAGQRMAEAIGRMGDTSAVSPLIEALASADEGIQARAAQALGMLQAREAVPGLRHVLLAGKPMAQRQAADALAAIGTPDAVSALLVPLGEREMTAARHAAMTGLERAGAVAAGPLTGALSSNDPALRAGAAEALSWIKPPSATAALADALADADPAVRTQAAWALGEIGTAQARRALASAVGSEQDETVRESASLALDRAESAARGGRAAKIGAGAALLGALSQVPPSRWSFLGMAVALALVVLFFGPRRAQPRSF